MLNANEKLLLEAINTFLSHKDGLGLPDPPDDWKEEESHSLQFLHEHINELFAVRAASLTHHDGACQAFKKVHNYKYVNDPTFLVAVEKEMKAQGIPESDQSKVLDIIPSIIEEVLKDGTEAEAGFHPNLDEIIEASRPGQE